MERKIKSQTAIYTGGGIYIYYGELEDGNYFIVNDAFEGATILNANPMERTGYEYSPYVSDDVEWQEKHLVEDFDDWNFIKQLYEKLIKEGCTFTEEQNWDQGDIEYRYENLLFNHRHDLGVRDKEYYGADAIYISEKTNEIYTAYHFADVKYLVMREREMDWEADDIGGSSVINWFVWDDNPDETLFDCLKCYADAFESMNWEDYMKEYNHI